jgi:predicted transcriptional regulator
MADSLQEMLKQDMKCESLLECFHGMGELEKQVFATIVESGEALTVDEIGGRVDRERSTAYRAVKRLRDVGFIRREQINYENGGYYHVYEPVDADVIADEMQRLLNDWYAQMGQLIQEFRKKYDQRSSEPAES